VNQASASNITVLTFAWTHFVSMDFHPPQGAHTSYLRTLSKIKGLRESVHPAPENISFKGAAHHTSKFASVNTRNRLFRRRAGTGVDASDVSGGCRTIEGARILPAIGDSSTAGRREHPETLP
jgi:hypothetical protein